MWWIHRGTGRRQFAAPGSRVALRFERSPAWVPETETPGDGQEVPGAVEEGVPDSRPVEAAESAERADGPPAAAESEIKPVGGGWYELPDGTRVQGRATAEEWLAGKARQQGQQSEAGGEE